MARKLTKRERNLLTAFLLAIFAILNLFGATLLFRKKEELQSRVVALRNEWGEARGWLAEKETWRQREEWLDKKQPKLKSTGEANAALLSDLQTSARKHKITMVTPPQFVEPSAQPFYQEIAVKFSISGTMKDIAPWLVELQQPANFQAIPSITMKCDNDPTKVICDLTVTRWYAPSH